MQCKSPKAFQSTLPVGGATSGAGFTIFSTAISIHAPRGGSDCATRSILKKSIYFNPRSPWGERLCCNTEPASDKDISIHAPRGGSDIFGAVPRPVFHVFQSTLPVGGATIAILLLVDLWRFQSTLPVGGATDVILLYVENFVISIHAPRGGSDNHTG